MKVKIVHDLNKNLMFNVPDQDAYMCKICAKFVPNLPNLCKICAKFVKFSKFAKFVQNLYQIWLF